MQRTALFRSAKFIFVLMKFILSEYDSFRFSLNFSAGFWMVFVLPGAAPPWDNRPECTKMKLRVRIFIDQKRTANLKD